MFFSLKALVEECSGLLDNLDGVTTVHGRFYELSSNYHKLMGNHALYYQEALRFLGCTDLNDIPGLLLFNSPMLKAQLSFTDYLYFVVFVWKKPFTFSTRWTSLN